MEPHLLAIDRIFENFLLLCSGGSRSCFKRSTTSRDWFVCALRLSFCLGRQYLKDNIDTQKKKIFSFYIEYIENIFTILRPINFNFDITAATTNCWVVNVILSNHRMPTTLKTTKNKQSWEKLFSLILMTKQLLSIIS